MTTTNRSTPSGEFLRDGYQALVAFNLAPTVAFWEKTVTPPGVSGGEPIDITNQHNTEWRMSAARSLRTLTPMTVTAAWDPALYDDVLTLLNQNGWITVHFPDGSSVDFVGYLKDFVPGQVVEGAQPEITITVVPTNEIGGVETAPQYNAPTP